MYFAVEIHRMSIACNGLPTGVCRQRMNGTGPSRRNQPVHKFKAHIINDRSVLWLEIQISHFPGVGFKVIKFTKIPVWILCGKHLTRIIHVPVVSLTDAFAPGKLRYANPVNFTTLALQQMGYIYAVTGFLRS